MRCPVSSSARAISSRSASVLGLASSLAMADPWLEVRSAGNAETVSAGRTLSGRLAQRHHLALAACNHRRQVFGPK
jgi:hypothetical protein